MLLIFLTAPLIKLITYLRWGAKIPQTRLEKTNLRDLKAFVKQGFFNDPAASLGYSSSIVAGGLPVQS